MSNIKSYQLPLSGDVLAGLRAGDELRLSGSCYTLRDASLARLVQGVSADTGLTRDTVSASRSRIKSGMTGTGDGAVNEASELLKQLSGQLVFFAGPTPPHSGVPELPFGSIGPTTAKRMDAGQIALMPAGMLVTLGKGARSAAYGVAAREHGAVYFAAVGGVAALLAQHVVASELVAWPELGTEAIMRLELHDFPVVVAGDVLGDDVYTLSTSTQDPSTAFRKVRDGVFITFEGGEGAGKSTQIEMLAEFLRSAGHEVLTLREPGSSAVSEAIRAILLDAQNSELSARAELFLYQAARAQLTEEVIKPALERGTVVLCDRFFDSTTAYQGYARGLDIADIEKFNLFATAGIVPDLSIVLDLPPEVGLARATQSSAPDRLESENMQFHQQVREGFLTIATVEPKRVKVVDAMGDTDVIAAEVQSLIDDLFSHSAFLSAVEGSCVPEGSVSTGISSSTQHEGGKI